MVDLTQFLIPEALPVGSRPVMNIYCDESCHLEGDGEPVMVLGAIFCPLASVHSISEELRSIKITHGFSKTYEIKWTKVSQGKVGFYEELVKYFFWKKDIGFRALVADKTQLNHLAHNQTHDDWYYKMYFDMLKQIINKDYRYRIYIDIKDSKGGQKALKLHNVLCCSHYDFQKEVFERLQIVRSDEIEMLQLADLLIGAVSYANRNRWKNAGKMRIVEMLTKYCGDSLTKKSSPLQEKKVNIFHWRGGNSRL